MALSWLVIWAVDARLVLLDSITNVAAFVVPLLIAKMVSYCPGAERRQLQLASGGKAGAQG
jgi:hypothetical protein